MHQHYLNKLTVIMMVLRPKYDSIIFFIYLVTFGTVSQYFSGFKINLFSEIVKSKEPNTIPSANSFSGKWIRVDQRRM